MKTKEFTFRSASDLFTLPPDVEILDQTPKAFLVTFNLGTAMYLELFTEEMFYDKCHYSTVLGVYPRSRIRGVSRQNSQYVDITEVFKVAKQHFDTTSLLFHNNKAIRDFFKKAV